MADYFATNRLGTLESRTKEMLTFSAMAPSETDPTKKTPRIITVPTTAERVALLGQRWRLGDEYPRVLLKRCGEGYEISLPKVPGPLQKKPLDDKLPEVDWDDQASVDDFIGALKNKVGKP